MERIRLSRREKTVLRTLQQSDFSHLSGFDTMAVAHLHSIGLVQAVFNEGHFPVDAVLTDFGKEYLRSNPRLHNPVRWEIVTAIATTVTAAVALTALILACSR